jgi:hypothetical protein
MAGSARHSDRARSITLAASLARSTIATVGVAFVVFLALPVLGIVHALE